MELLDLDRRRLLTSAAALACGIAPGRVRAELAMSAQRVDPVRSVTPALKASVGKVCAVTARRLLEIARRNEIRRDAKLPLLSIAKELRRMKEQDDNEALSRFAASSRKTIWQQVLERRREREDNPNWRPGWTEGMAYQNEVHKMLLEQWEATRRMRSM